MRLHCTFPCKVTRKMNFKYVAINMLMQVCMVSRLLSTFNKNTNRNASGCVELLHCRRRCPPHRTDISATLENYNGRGLASSPVLFSFITAFLPPRTTLFEIFPFPLRHSSRTHYIIVIQRTPMWNS